MSPALNPTRKGGEDESGQSSLSSIFRDSRSLRTHVVEDDTYARPDSIKQPSQMIDSHAKLARDVMSVDFYFACNENTNSNYADLTKHK